MKRTVQYHSIETRYEMVLDQEEESFLVDLPEWLTEQEDGAVLSSDGMVFESLAEMTNHYRCEIVSVDSDPGN